MTNGPAAEHSDVISQDRKHGQHHHHGEEARHDQVLDRINGHDFKRFAGKDAVRIRYWRTAVAESERLADEFMELIEGQQLEERILPLA